MADKFDFTTFRTLVAEMRHNQREYFRTRSASALEASKATERKVDAALKQLTEDEKRPLFGEGK